MSENSDSLLQYDDLPKLVGAPAISSSWLTIGQRDIDRFAELIGDRYWIHVDVDRATRERGGTIAHGFLVLSMLSQLAYRNFGQDLLKGFNYGFDKLRFTGPVRAGAEIRLTQSLKNLEERGEGCLLRWDISVDIKDNEKPAIVGQWLLLVLR